MAHPMSKTAKDGAQAKLARITSSGQMLQTNKGSPAETMSAGEPRPMDAGYGAENSPPKARGDRAGRARGGSCKATGGEVPARASGGRTKKGATQVNVIVAGGSQPPQPSTPVIPPTGSAAPPAPPMPPPGAGAKPPMVPPGAMPPGAVPPGMMRAKGGKVSHPDEKEDRALFGKMLKERGLKDGGAAARASGGRMTAGAESGPGRLQKAALQPKVHPQTV